MSNKDDKKKATQASTVENAPLQVVKDFQEFGRITSENLNDFFDNEVMTSLTVHAKRRRRRRKRD